MELEYYLTLNQDEVKKTIPYALIVETMGGARWNTGRRKRMWRQLFNEEERDMARKLYNRAYKWYLVTGVPEEVKMRPQTLVLWQRLGDFCAAI